MTLDLNAARDLFEDSTDFTVGIEEEFALLDATTLNLVPRFEDLMQLVSEDEVLAASAAGELISSEIEIRSGRGENFPHAVALQAEHRARLFATASKLGIALGAAGAHPWSPWQDQQVIDTEHYHRVEDGLKYVAWRNNTFSLHVHVGVRNGDRAIAVCDRLRELLPLLLAVSASSPLTEGRDTGLASARTQLFTRNFPRCGVPEPFVDWRGYQDFVEFLIKTNSIVESTQLWWSVRPHHSFGTVEVRICDAQPSGERSTALAGLIVACVAQAARDYDEGLRPQLASGRMIEENLWRAIRYGLDGKMIDFERTVEYPAAAIVDNLLQWTAPVRAELGIEPSFDGLDPVTELRQHDSLEAAYRASVAQTAATYGQIRTDATL
ncbi:MAG: YbdK family carboxylate-amine ligase [Thermoleophilaceae bacterium]|nr:YbdK family carboxylate-amine ligase [Thermoleophilaceae bacterium]